MYLTRAIHVISFISLSSINSVIQHGVMYRIKVLGTRT